jgi:hypothetical protein
VSATSSVGSAVSFSASGLPAGLSIDPASGVISGAPAGPGASTINVQARDGDGAAGSTSFQWIVRDATVTLAAIQNQSGVVGTPVTLRLRATVDNGRLPSYSAAGLPPGVSVAPATGIVSGVPTGAGRFKVTATATDASGASAHTVFTWAIVHPLRSTRAGLTAVSKHHPKLSFTLSAIDRAAAIKTISIAPPHGLSFAAHRRGIAVAVSRGSHVRFTTAVRHGVLTLKLSKAVTTLRVMVGDPSLRVSGALARKVASGRAGLLTVAVAAADGEGLRSRLTFRVRPH